jgi:hypothetical protein
VAQLSLFDRDKTIQERFDRFCIQHPDVFSLFRKIAWELRGRGYKRYSADGILHIVRYNYDTSGNDAAGFKINNVFSSRFARKLIAEDPTFDGFFETRVLKSE